MSDLFHLIYTSKACKELSVIELEELVKPARFKNFLHHLSGLLLYGEQQFIQVLEGPENDIDLIFESILLDKRHHSIRIIQKEPIKKRAFLNWNMGLVVFSQHPDIKEKLANQSPEEINYTAFTNYNAISILERFSKEDFLKYIA